jgi:hypothetical protein
LPIQVVAIGVPVLARSAPMHSVSRESGGTRFTTTNEPSSRAILSVSTVAHMSSGRHYGIYEMRRDRIEIERMPFPDGREIPAL